MPAPISATRFVFTEARLKAIANPTPGKKVRYKDSACPGLGLRVTGDVRTFIWYGKADGRPEEIRLGAWPTMTVEAARKVAKGTIGPNPTAAAESRRAIRKESTLAELWSWFNQHHVGHLRPSTVRCYRDTWRIHLLPALGSKRLTAIHRRDVQAMADGVAAQSGNGAGRICCGDGRRATCGRRRAGI